MKPSTQHDLNDLRLFVAVAEAGGFASAARKLAIARATLSRRIADFEAALSQRLIERSSRSFRLTAAGEALFNRARPFVAAAPEVFAALDLVGDTPRGEIRFAVAPSVLQLGLQDMVASYLAEFPQVRLRVEATNRKVDLMREEYDFLIRAGDPGRAIGDLVALPLAHVEHIIVAAPRWQTSLLPDVRQTLETVPTLAWGPADTPSSWHLLDAQGGPHQIKLEPRLSVEDMAGLRVAALQGLGLALLPKVMVAQELAEGRLIAAPFALCAPDGKIHALHTGKRGMRPLVRHFLDWLVVAYSRHCEVWS
ncbi:LysR substrate-binding domain-containing protein [Falsigemmobacter intermedius]|uniref:LysR substrate-binding domain-containing protein n=1 Tax=Falsigemmobacter intermedius TaxID=1553448 RepID=UPI003EFE6FEA